MTAFLFSLQRSQPGGLDRQWGNWNAKASLLDSVSVWGSLHKFLFVCLLFLAPAAMGGRHPAGMWAYTIIIAAGCALCLGQVARGATSWKISLGPLIFGAIVVCIPWLQIQQLPQGLVVGLAPGYSSLMSEAQQLDLMSPHRFSLVPRITAQAVWSLITIVSGIVWLWHFADSEHRIHWLLHALANATAFWALIGLAQFFFGNGKFLWIYDHPTRETFGTVKGPFQNANHFAQLMAVGIGPLCFALVTALRADTASFRCETRRSAGRSSFRPLGHRSWFYLASLCVTLVAGLLTCSRGGMLAIAIAVLASGFALHRTKLIRISGWLLPAGLLLLGAGTLLIGPARLHEKASTLATAGSLRELSRGRALLWSADLAVWRSFPILGTGIGSHQFAYPIYYPEVAEQTYVYAESSVVQLLLETGLVGFALMIVAIISVLRLPMTLLAAAPQSSNALLAVALFPGLAASCAHALIDFIWHIPSTFAPAAILAIIAWRAVSSLLGMLTTETIAPPRWIAAPALTLCLVLSLCACVQKWQRLNYGFAWDNYLHSLPSPDEDVPDERVASALNYLEQAIASDPTQVRAVQRYVDYQLAAANDASGGARVDEASLQKMMQRCIAECPLEGRTYAQLAVFSDLPSPQKLDLIRQAVRLRPYDPVTLYLAGNTYAMCGHFEISLKLWQSALDADPENQTAVARSLSQALPVRILLDQFELPTASAAELFERVYAANDPEASLVGDYYLLKLGRELENTTVTDRKIALLDSIASVARRTGKIGQAIEAALLLTRLQPGSFDRHHYLAMLYLKARDYDSASEELMWCVSRRPEDHELKNAFEQAKVASMQLLKSR
ncbi:MAG: O-antigen ligase family protein [Candidatus Paceibacterota bacterium]